VNSSRRAATRAAGSGGYPVASRERRNLPVPVAAADHPLRRVRLRRGLTQVELAGLAGLSFSYISMIETGQRVLTRRDHVNALAAALRVPPTEIAPAMVPGSDEWAPGPAGRFPLAPSPTSKGQDND
jgi:DNA-binding XRE family transcriptional regulator